MEKKKLTDIYLDDKITKEAYDDKYSEISNGKLKLKASLSKCGRTSVENEVEYIRQNVPGIFVDEEE